MNIARSAAKRRRTPRQKARLALLRLLAPGIRALPSLRHTLPNTPTVPRILVIRPDHLGDILFTTPALHVLREQVPQATITALIGPWGEAILAGNPDVDRVIACPFPGFRREGQGSPVEHYRLLWDWARALRRQEYDIAFILRADHWWGALLAALAGIPQRIGYAVPEVAPFLTEAQPVQSGCHEVARSLALIDRSGRNPSYSPAEYPLRFYPGQADRKFAADFFGRHDLGPTAVAIHPGAGAEVKRWLPERWAAVADHLMVARGVRVLLTGSTAEQGLCQEIARRMSSPAVVTAGQTALGQLAALFERCILVLGPDSGPLHLAVAMGTPTVHLYGPADPLAFGPWGDRTRHRVILSPLACAPCGHLDWQRLEEHPCMREIALQAVIDRLSPESPA